MSEPKPVWWADAPAMCPYCPHAEHKGVCSTDGCWCWLPETADEKVQPSAGDLWKRIVASVIASNPRFTIINALHPASITDTHLTLTAPPDVASYLNSRRISIDMLTLTAAAIAGRPLTIDIQPQRTGGNQK